MIILSETTDNLQVVLGGSITTNQLRCASFWRDVTTTLYTPGRTVVLTNNTTDVNIAPAPGSSTQRIIDYISVYNADTVNATVTIKLDANGTEYILFKAVLGIGEMLQYNDKNGFTTMTIAGAVKQAQFAGTNNVAVNTLNIVTLSADVTNAEVVANTLTNVTGMSFSVTAGETYWFEFIIDYTAPTTATGSRWTINGPSFSRLAYTSEYSLTSTTKTINNLIAYQQPAACNATSGQANGNIATIWGIITPSANGTVQLQFASETTVVAIVAKAGSILRWLRTV